MTIIRYVKQSQSKAVSRADQYLFQRYDLHASLLVQQELINAEIDQYDGNELVAAEVEQIATYLETKYLVEPPLLIGDKVTIEERPTKIDVRNHSYRDVIDRNVPTLLEGVEVRFHVPIEGDPDLLNSAPAVIYVDGSAAPGTVMGSQVVLSYRGLEMQPNHLRSQFDRDLQQIERRLGSLGANIRDWNTTMRDHIRERIATRRKRLGALKSTFGFPLRSRAEPIKGYDRSAIARRAIRPTAVGGEAYLEMAHYEDILLVLSRMSTVMERAPSAFATMDEEAVRHQFLVPLNVLYEGQAHAEAFNFQGKTDILIRVGDRAVFIAECKFWKGEKALDGAVDQLLGYTS